MWRLEEYGSHGKYGLHTIVMIDMTYIQSRPSRPSLMQAESLLVLSNPSRPSLNYLESYVDFVNRFELSARSHILGRKVHVESYKLC